ncbi:hypothetical protein SAMN03159343_0896 [Klenkia marina]|uniref:Uncharacterized protein n=1 Tax=Klenkia marina TaxID=1960309 RepID=A0A1G4XGB4_9ACTN|nr:hypothetical protein SAMN03159343_0896 [Klenkia marina]
MPPAGDATALVPAVAASPPVCRIPKLPVRASRPPSAPRPATALTRGDRRRRANTGATSPAPAAPPNPPPRPACTVESTFQSVRLPSAICHAWVVTSMTSSSSTSSAISYARCRPVECAATRPASATVCSVTARRTPSTSALRPAASASLSSAAMTACRAVLAMGPSPAKDSPPAQAMTTAMTAAIAATATATLTDTFAYCSSTPNPLVCCAMATAFWMWPGKPNSGDPSSLRARSSNPSAAGASQAARRSAAAACSPSDAAPRPSARSIHSWDSSQTAVSLPSGQADPAKIIDSRSFQMPSPSAPSHMKGLTTSSGCSITCSGGPRRQRRPRSWSSTIEATCSSSPFSIARTCSPSATSDMISTTRSSAVHTACSMVSVMRSASARASWLR